MIDLDLIWTRARLSVLPLFESDKRMMKMQMQVKVIYNPFTQAAMLGIDGADNRHSSSKIYQFVERQPMDSWLDARTSSYQHWNGFLVELVTELNEDDICLSFYGTQEDNRVFVEGINQQSVFLEEIGFSAKQITFSYTEKYTVNVVLQEMKRLREKWNVPVPTQELILRRDYLDGLLETTTDIEDVYRLVVEYVKLISDILHTVNLEADRKFARAMRNEWEKLIQ